MQDPASSSFGGKEEEVPETGLIGGEPSKHFLLRAFDSVGAGEEEEGTSIPKPELLIKTLIPPDFSRGGVLEC